MKSNTITEQTMAEVPFRTPTSPSNLWIVFNSPQKDYVRVQTKSGAVMCYLATDSKTFENASKAILQLVTEHNKTLEK